MADEEKQEVRCKRCGRGMGNTMEGFLAEKHSSVQCKYCNWRLPITGLHLSDCIRNYPKE